MTVPLHAETFIRVKRDGGEHDAADLRSFVHAFTNGDVPDYQAAAWLMSVYFRGLTFAETLSFTRALVETGDRLHAAQLPGAPVDKHSTGGVGDKTTLVLVPLVAAAGQPVVKLSGRGLGHTGGTIDKLESIPGFSVERSRRQMAEQVAKMGCVIASQTGELVPGDGRFYRLRDVTGTVESLPLIAASIMSKKVATGSKGVVLDVKLGRGALLQRHSQAVDLAKTMVRLGQSLDLRARAVISDMDAPLGWAVGNALEVREAARLLQGYGPSDLRELCLTLGSHMLVLGGSSPDVDAARRRLEKVLSDGSAWDTFLRLIEAQGGEPEAVARDRLPQAPVRRMVQSSGRGWVTEIDALAVGRIVLRLGAGRSRKEDEIDPAVGVELLVRRGQHLEAGAPLGVIHARTGAAAEQAEAALRRAVATGQAAPPQRPLIHEVVT